jgi:hypothetical protein
MFASDTNPPPRWSQIVAEVEYITGGGSPSSPSELQRYNLFNLSTNSVLILSPHLN